jgi:hypothetical protein
MRVDPKLFGDEGGPNDPGVVRQVQHVAADGAGDGNGSGAR